MKIVCSILSVLVLVMVAGAEEARFYRVSGPSNTAILALQGDGWMSWANTLTSGVCVVETATSIGPSGDWQSYVCSPVTGAVSTLRTFDPAPPDGMVLIPAGNFVMGATTNVGHESYSGETPQHTVYVSAFYIEQYEVTKGEWDEVYAWATNNGYGFDYAGSGKAANHPVQTVSWYDVVKWCNARSQKEGMTPCYMVEGGVYTNGKSAPDCNWTVVGYRLPTEAEWEKAARGGVANTRFSWSDVDTIDHSRANYYGKPANYAYDLGYEGFDTNYMAGGGPHTSPIGAFAPNGYGLYDMAGNVWEWCWDWHDWIYYETSPGTDPRGPVTGSYRILRGGGWVSFADICRVGFRRYGHAPGYAYNDCGFRVVLPAGQ